MAKAATGRVVDKMEQLRVADAVSEIFTLLKRCNKYIDETEPWILAKDDAKKDRLATVLYNLIEGIRISANLLSSFMPETAEKILAQINADKCDIEDMEKGFGQYPSGTKVTEKPEILFQRLDIDEVMERVLALEATAGGAGTDASGATDAGDTTAPDGTGKSTDESEGSSAVIDIEQKPEITYDDFMKCQFQVGEIVACEVKDSRKLLCSQVKIGSKTRQIVSGIKKWYKPEDLVGKKVMVLVNLKPATLAGLKSEGMLLSAEGPDGNVRLIHPSDEMPSGSEISA